MKKLVSVIALGGAISAAVMVLLALCAMFASLAMPDGSAFGNTMTAASGSLFAFSRIGLLLAIVGGALYAGFFVDWSAAVSGEAPPSPDAKPQDQQHNSLD